MKLNKAFTMAEVVLTLSIVGIVASLTIATVIKNYRAKQYNTTRMKALRTFGDAGKQSSIYEEVNGWPSAEDFVRNSLSKYLKIVHVCDKAAKCDFPEYIQPLDKSADKIKSDDLKSWRHLNNNVATNNAWTAITATNYNVYVTTADGFSAKIFYNPKCTSDDKENAENCNKRGCTGFTVDNVCMNVIYDMNGKKAPNYVSEDIGFVSVFWSGLGSTSAAPGLLTHDVYKEVIQKASSEIYGDDDSRVSYEEGIKRCASYNTGNEQYSLPSVDELASLILNRSLVSMPKVSYFWAGSPTAAEKSDYWWYVDTGSRRGPRGQNNREYVWCVRR